MAVAHTGTPTSATTDGAGLTINKPAGVAVGDLLLAFVMGCDDDVATITPPSGWTSVRTQAIPGISQTSGCWYRFVDGSEGSSFSWTFSSQSASFPHTGCILAFSGVDTTTPVHTSNSANFSSNTSHALPAVTSTRGGALHVGAIVGWRSSGTATTSWHADYTERVDTFGNQGLVTAATRNAVVDPAGAGTSPTMNANTTSQSVAGARFSVLLNAKRQLAAPAGDVSRDGDWQTNGGATTNIYQAIDEEPASDSDYIAHSAISGTYVLALGSVTDPASSASHVIRMRVWRTSTSSSLTVQLRQGATNITGAQAVAFVGSSSWADFFYTLSGAEADAITNYGDLDLALAGANTLSNLRVGYAALEVPQASSTAVSADLQGLYDVQGTVQADLGGTFDVQGTVSADLAGAFDVQATVSADLAGSYDVHDAVSADLAGAYDVAGMVTSDLQGAFGVRALVARSLDALYDVQAQVTAALEGLYDVLGTVVADLAGVADVQNTVSADLGGVFDVQGDARVSADLTGSFEVSNLVAADLAGAYDVAAMVSADLGGAYTLRAQVGAELAGSFDTSGLVGRDLTGSFDAQGTLIVELQGRYGVRAQVGADLTGAFDTRNLVSGDLQGVYGVRASTSASLIASYELTANPARSLIAVYSVALPEGADTDALQVLGPTHRRGAVSAGTLL